MGKDTYRVRVTNWPSMVFWTAGYLFTLGYLGLFMKVDSIWDIIISALFAYLIWPLLLGISLAGGV